MRSTLFVFTNMQVQFSLDLIIGIQQSLRMLTFSKSPDENDWFYYFIWKVGRSSLCLLKSLTEQLFLGNDCDLWEKINTIFWGSFITFFYPRFSNMRSFCFLIVSNIDDWCPSDKVPWISHKWVIELEPHFLSGRMVCRYPKLFH